MIIQAAVRTHPGRIRDKNEDNFYLDGMTRDNWGANSAEYACERHNLYYDFAVCDGMGGESYGEVASSMAVHILADYDISGNGGSFHKLINEANTKICREISKRRVKRMGTTMAHLHLCCDDVSICNIGDSRIYMYDQGVLMQLTRDHRSTAGADSISVLTQHIGIFPEEFVIEPFVLTGITLTDGMIFILCTDGLTDMVSGNKLQRTFDSCKNKSPQNITDTLVDLALESGGKDNVTVMVVKAVGKELR